MRSTFGLVATHVAVVATLFLSLGELAYAQTPATDQYGTKAKGVSVAEESQQPAVEAEQSSLPNTGLSLLGAVVVGGTLVGLGVVLRRREQAHDGVDI